ncbi:hypothetical protein N9W89_06520 [Hellea sp.]|nr:hypothetical protein [Hellea sp.]
MNIKTIALISTAFSLFAVEAYAHVNHDTAAPSNLPAAIEANQNIVPSSSLLDVKIYAQANHNTTRSNRKKGGIVAPADTGTPDVEVETTSSSQETTGHVTLVRRADPSGGDTATGCVMLDRSPDENCDGVADDAVPTKIDDRRTIRRRPEPRQQRR